MKTLIVILLGWMLLLPELFAAGQDDVDRSAAIVREFRDMPERRIPRRLLRDARGVAILSVVKAGFWVSGKGGKGVVVARTANGWSGPAFIATGGAGFGPQIGVEVNDIVLILNTDAAVKAFERGGNVNLGGDVSVAVGPVGRDVKAGAQGLPAAAIYSYSRSKGLFAGASLEGAVIVSRNSENERYYGHPVKPGRILSGRAPAPAGSSHLLSLLGR